MRIALDQEQVALKEELQGYFSALVTPEVKAGLASATGEFGEASVYKSVIKQLGTDGWLGIGWPKEYGGQDRSMVDQLIFTDVARSEEHTSELQSRRDLVCRLLLEKKKVMCASPCT